MATVKRNLEKPPTNISKNNMMLKQEAGVPKSSQKKMKLEIVILELSISQNWILGIFGPGKL